MAERHCDEQEGADAILPVVYCPCNPVGYDGGVPPDVEWARHPPAEIKKWEQVGSGCLGR